jgi:hypothetical protein
MPSGYEQLPEYGGRPPIDPRRAGWIVAWAVVMALLIFWLKFGL